MSVDELIRWYKSQTKAAEALGVAQSAISNWKARGKIPPLQQLKAQTRTRGKLKADEGCLS